MPLVNDRTFRDLVQARQFIADCYQQPLLLDDIAAVAYLSPSHFQREYRRAFGESPLEFVTRLRMERAKRLLESTNLTVLEVCWDVGFHSLGSFTSRFTRHVQLSPARYRRVCRTTVSVDGFRDWTRIPFCFAWMVGVTPGGPAMKPQDPRSFPVADLVDSDELPALPTKVNHDPTR